MRKFIYLFALIGLITACKTKKISSQSKHYSQELIQEEVQKAISIWNEKNKQSISTQNEDSIITEIILSKPDSTGKQFIQSLRKIQKQKHARTKTTAQERNRLQDSSILKQQQSQTQQSQSQTKEEAKPSTNYFKYGYLLAIFSILILSIGLFLLFRKLS